MKKGVKGRQGRQGRQTALNIIQVLHLSMPTVVPTLAQRSAKGQQRDWRSGRWRKHVWRPATLNRTMTHHDAGTKWKMEVIREQDFGIDQHKTPGDSPGVDGISRWIQNTSTSGQRSVEQPSRPPQRILDLSKVTNRHHLEDQPIDVGFNIFQGCAPIASWLPGWFPCDRSRGFRTRSSSFLACGGCPGLLGLATLIPRQSQQCSRLVDEGGADRPLESGCRPRLVHVIDVALGMVVQKLLDEHGLAWSCGCSFGHSGG